MVPEGLGRPKFTWEKPRASAIVFKQTYILLAIVFKMRK